jgi:hypothetical protein
MNECDAIDCYATTAYRALEFDPIPNMDLLTTALKCVFNLSLQTVGENITNFHVLYRPWILKDTLDDADMLVQVNPLEAVTFLATVTSKTGCRACTPQPHPSQYAHYDGCFAARQDIIYNYGPGACKYLGLDYSLDLFSTLECIVCGSNECLHDDCLGRFYVRKY